MNARELADWIRNDARYQAGLAGDGGVNGHEPPAGGAGAVRSEAPARTAAEVTERFRARHGL